MEKSLKSWCASLRTAVADGGPAEQGALYECSPSAPAAEFRVSPTFPNLMEITRDRAHKLRSVQKGVWSHLAKDLNTFMDELVSGEHSLAKMLNDSKNASGYF